jgi:hypothetical protein
MSNVEPVTGASMKVVDKMGFERTTGFVSYDDKLIVVSQDASKTVEYFLTFFNEKESDAPNQAPIVSAAFADSTVQTTVVISISAVANDDDLPDPPGAMTYLWSVTTGNAAGVSIVNPDQLTTDVSFTEAGSYVLTLTANDGELSGSDAISFTVNTVGFGLSDMDNIMIYPNPAREAIHVNFGGIASEAEIRIVDLTGKVAYLSHHHADQVEIDVNGLDQGIYFMILNIENESLITKINIVK